MVRSPQLTVTSGAIIGFFVSLLFIGGVFAAPSEPAIPTPSAYVQTESLPPPPLELNQISFTTVITVTSSADPDELNSRVCYTPRTGGQVVGDSCTLRRAIIEANSVPASERPVLISFGLPITDTNHISSTGIWKIPLRFNLPNIGAGGGQITIDGATQPDGRSDGKPIVFIQNRSFQLGAQSADSNIVIRNLGFQNATIIVSRDGNTIEDNWLGVSDDGQGIYTLTADPRSTGNATIDVNAGNTLVQRNVVVSHNGIDIQGTGNTVRGNFVGTNADGVVPNVPANRFCQPAAFFQNWYGGGGIDVSGSNNIIGGPTAADRNIIAGLLIPGAQVNPGIAFFSGNNNIAQNNFIGRDAAGNDVGVCDLGIRADGKGLQLLDNVIVRSQNAAIGVFGSATSAGEITWRGNQIIRPRVKTGVDFGQNIPNAWKLFQPAIITEINGTSVSGTSAPDFDCPNCVIELFVDNLDDTLETLRSVAVVTASATGAWTATLTTTLGANEALRTSSTTGQFNTITNFGAGTSTQFSRSLYNASGVVSPTATPPDPPFVPQPPQPNPLLPTMRDVPALPTIIYASIITVTSTADVASLSQTCYTAPTGGNQITSPCTLRRALTEARVLPGNQRPVLIRFDIPTDDPNYDAATQTWRIVLGNTALPVLRDGNVTIDGFTQPGGRSDGPPIAIEGQPLQLGEVRGDSGYIVRGILFRNASLSVNSDDSFVEDNWFGYNLDGQTIFFPNNNPAANNNASVRVNQFASNVVLRNNRLAGTRSVAIVMSGDDSYVVGNYIGTRTDGTLPPPPDEELRCSANAASGNWFGGYGMQIAGSRNQVTDNVFAGLLATGQSTPPTVLDFDGSAHYIFNNRLGVDANGADSYNCGTGMVARGEFTQVISNVINAAAAEGAFFIGDTGNNTISFRSNRITNPNQYLSYAIQVPVSLRTFNPARITSINGTSVAGTAGTDSPCPYCTIEVFLENDDAVVETLESLAIVTAAANGTWSATLPRPLAANERLRTLSTLSDFGQVPGFERDTTIPAPSQLYPQDEAIALDSLTIDGPESGDTGTEYRYTVTLTPPDATRPITITASVTDQTTEPVVLDESSNEAIFDFTWDQAGEKTLIITATNAVNGISNTLTVSIEDAQTGIGVAIVNLTGDSTGTVGTSYDFTARVSPSNATTPITYTWIVDEQEQFTASTNARTNRQSFTWATTGTKTITVTAVNSTSSATATATIEIGAAPAPVAPASVTITGPQDGAPNTAYSFTAQVAPNDATTPITYTWIVDEQEQVTASTNARTNQQSFTWATAGTKTLTVTATNRAGSATTTATISIEAPSDIVLEPGTPLVITPTNGIEISFPANTVSETVTLAFSQNSTRTPPEGFQVVRRLLLFDRNAEGNVRRVDNPFRVLAIIDGSLLPSGTTAADVRVFAWDGTGWVELTNINRPTLAQALTFSFDTDRLTEFLFVVPQQERTTIFLPFVVRGAGE